MAATRLSVFVTDLGWFGLVGIDATVHALTIGHTGPDQVHSAILGRGGLEAAGIECERDWHPRLRADLQAYARGERVDFSGYRVALQPSTAFQKRVLRATRRIPYGGMLSYAELAEKVDCQRGARAVGNVMASNRTPILIPCHRVVGSGGGLGGFSAPQGVSLKQRMLRLERGEPG
jgi:methylated-DNA-[protein]-cysteine S-methyltransferase